MNTSLSNKLDQMVQEHVKEEDVVYSNSLHAVNNIFYDTALTANYFFESAMQQDFSYALRFFGNRMKFGSDYPDFTVKAAIQRMKQIVDFASGNDDLYHRYSSINAQKVFCQKREGTI